MATTFDTREQAFERRFVLKEEARFHARNRRNRLLAGWACERMRLTGSAAEGYVTSFTERAVVTDDETLIERLLKRAAIEAVWHTEPGPSGLTLFGYPDTVARLLGEAAGQQDTR